MEPAVRLVRLVQITMLVSIVLYVAAGELLHRKPAPENTVFHALSFVAISIVGAAFVVRRTLVLPAEYLLTRRPDDKMNLARWRTGYIFTYSLCDAVGLMGLVLRTLGFALANVWGFYLGGFLLLLLFYPRPPHPQFR